VCIALCTIVAHNIAQNRPDSFPPYPPDNHHCSDDVYLREGEGVTKRGNTKIVFFSLKCCISVLPECNQSLLDFFSLFDSRLILTLLYDSLNLVVNAFSSGLLIVLGAWFRRKEVEIAAAVGLLHA